MSTYEALENGDILYSVCAVLADSSESKTLIRLARVNRLFNECATPRLWRTLNSLLPLFKIFSHLMVSQERGCGLSWEVYVSIEASNLGYVLTSLCPRHAGMERHLDW